MKPIDYRFNRDEIVKAWKKAAESAIQKGRVLNADEELDVILETARSTLTIRHDQLVLIVFQMQKAIEETVWLGNHETLLKSLEAFNTWKREG